MTFIRFLTLYSFFHDICHIYSFIGILVSICGLVLFDNIFSLLQAIVFPFFFIHFYGHKPFSTYFFRFNFDGFIPELQFHFDFNAILNNSIL